jgi:hypothetical protein
VTYRALLLAAGLSLAASEAPAQEAATSEAIVVTAQRSGAPIWTIDTARGTILLVGEIVAVPKATPWRPERLEAATRSARRVILGTKAKVSPGDIFRLIFAGGKLTKLPNGTRAADYLDDSQRRRLALLEQRYDQDYSRQSFLMTGFDLLAKRLGFNRDTGADATEVVRKAADRADVPAEPVGTIRGEDILDDLFTAPPESHLPCLDAAMTATERGPGLIAQRGADWRGFDVPAVMANPLEVALGRCWPWADEELGTELRGQWTDAIYRATHAEGVTLAVVPLRVLAEQDGVLDQLERRGLDIAGPAWR